jgi:hypothetical protein
LQLRWRPRTWLVIFLALSLTLSLAPYLFGPKIRANSLTDASGDSSAANSNATSSSSPPGSPPALIPKTTTTTTTPTKPNVVRLPSPASNPLPPANILPPNSPLVSYTGVGAMISWADDLNKNLSNVKFYRNGVASHMARSVPGPGLSEKQIGKIAKMYATLSSSSFFLIWFPFLAFV